ncbi:MAG: hypothetical protein FWB96_13305 [Defluviitaleaceae bacterium]|nr:hypothetical protein [Defluviitaleaceae bacterium]MCL2264238.1 hypothetical protein [Defluviitaleaceae bacterium]
MYEILKDQKRMTSKEINKTFKGKWVYMIKPEDCPERFYTAIPVVIADIPFEGVETGLYDKIYDEYDGDVMSIAYLMNKYHVFGFSEGVLDEGV